jgi:hypothetical protein
MWSSWGERKRQADRRDAEARQLQLNLPHAHSSRPSIAVIPARTKREPQPAWAAETCLTCKTRLDSTRRLNIRPGDVLSRE